MLIIVGQKIEVFHIWKAQLVLVAWTEGSICPTLVCTSYIL